MSSIPHAVADHRSSEAVDKAAFLESTWLAITVERFIIASAGSLCIIDHLAGREYGKTRLCLITGRRNPSTHATVSLYRTSVVRLPWRLGGRKGAAYTTNRRMATAWSICTHDATRRFGPHHYWLTMFSRKAQPKRRLQAQAAQMIFWKSKLMR